MSGGSRIIGLWGQGQQDAAAVEQLPGPLEQTEDFDEPVGSLRGRIAAGAVVVAGLAWTAVATWSGWPRLAAGDRDAVVATIALVSAPLALLGVVWLLAMRTSRAEARRFGTTARAMRIEAARLERVLAQMSRRLEDNRLALQEQTGAMLALGENAAMRIAAVGAGIGEQAASIAASANRLDAAGATTGDAFGRLLDALPAAHDHTVALTAALAEAGTAADERVGALDRGMALLGERSDAAHALADGAAAALGERLTQIADEGIRAGTNIAQVERTVEHVTAGLIDVDARLGTLHEIGVGRAQQLAASISALGGSADAMTEALRVGDATAEAMIVRAEAALTAIDAVAREIDETLPEALGRLDARIADSRGVVAAAKPELLALVTAAESTHSAIAAIAAVIHDQRDTLDQLSGNLAETLASSTAKSDALGAMVEETIGRAQSFARDAAPQLVDALLRVRDTANTAAERARETLAVVIPEAAAALESSAANALKRATAASVERQVLALADAAEVAVEAAQRASDRLTRQLMSITDTTAVVEARIADARAEREAHDEDTIARRSTGLLEALNSHAIDISDALAAEPSDSAWAAYLKGDRGVFTRRAVRLLDGGAARGIAQLYADDPHFRDQVNRYIHDFEAMLRGILATRDGAPLGITLLSSAMGKLYVALAQAIERLRT